MSGPAVGILLKNPMSSVTQKNLSSYIHSISGTIQGEDFWVKKHPFTLSLIEENGICLEDYLGLKKHIGWNPKSEIILSAICNRIDDHVILGKIALETAKITNGRIAFNGDISKYTKDSQVLNNQGLIHFDNESIITIPLFELWLQHKDFCMVT